MCYLADAGIMPQLQQFVSVVTINVPHCSQTYSIMGTLNVSQDFLDFLAAVDASKETREESFLKEIAGMFKVCVRAHALVVCISTFHRMYRPMT